MISECSYSKSCYEKKNLLCLRNIVSDTCYVISELQVQVPVTYMLFLIMNGKRE
jgi:hypothetical protein